MPSQRLFTLEEALQLLPAVRQLLTEIRDARHDLDAKAAELDRLLGLTGARLESLISELDDLGVELKGIDDGLVDFPSEREGRVVLLCWRLGEDTIAWWHEVEAGFAGRQPL